MNEVAWNINLYIYICIFFIESALRTGRHLFFLEALNRHYLARSYLQTQREMTLIEARIAA